MIRLPQISEDAIVQAGRPLSPHLQIYRWYLTMALSILHRATGIALSLGLLLLTWWLVALAAGPETFGTIRAVMDNWFGGLVLFGFTAALAYHLCNGIRHLFWDAGYGFDPAVAKQTGIVVLAAAAILTVLVWIAVLIVA